jgi:bleomycin hydrolase
MEQISKEWLDMANKQYKKSKNLNTLRRAIAKNDINSSTYNIEYEGKDKFNFSIDIPTMSATNQKQSGRCWIFAGLNFLREIVAKKYNIENFEFSQNYVAFYDKLEKINFILEKSIELRHKDADDRVVVWLLSSAIADGGQWDMFVNVVEKYGLVSKDAMPETNASNGTRQMNYLINSMLRKFNAKIRNETNESKIRDIKDKTMEDAYNLLCTCFGVPPTKFDFEYVDKDKKYHLDKNVLPLEFYNNYVGDVLKNYVSIINAPTKDKPFNKMYTVDYLGNVIDGKDIKYLNLEMKEFKELVLKQLTNKELVWFGSDCSQYGDRAKGHWDDRLFSYNESFEIDFDLTKEESLMYRHSAMNHAMVLTGVNVVDRKPTKWKIENSWGSDVANKGYYMCSDSWFDRFVYQAVIDKKYLNDAQKKALKSKPIHLNPWDPMGTLAD